LGLYLQAFCLDEKRQWSFKERWELAGKVLSIPAKGLQKVRPP
jgi:hypothetical protein